jgi:hypothetical protein
MMKVKSLVFGVGEHGSVRSAAAAATSRNTLDKRRDVAGGRHGGRHYYSCAHPATLADDIIDESHVPVRVHANGDRTLQIRHRYHYHRQPTCRVENCWDLSRCRGRPTATTSTTNDDANNTTNHPFFLTLYVNGSASDALVDYAIRQSRYPLV